MARKNKTKSKSVYERIEEKKQNIKEVEEMLVQLNNELQKLFAEKDQLEMELLLQAMKEKGLTINEALSKFESESLQKKETSASKINNKKAIKEIAEDVAE